MGNMLKNTDPTVASTDNTSVSEEFSANGLYLNGHYIPEEVLIILLSHVDPEQFLKCKLVCKLWNRTIKSKSLWHEICRRKNMELKCLPWYVYYAKFATDFFDTNLIKNGNGQAKFDDWVIKPVFSGDGFQIENEPHGAKPLPENIEEFQGHKSCFATSFGLCSKQQILKFKNQKLRKLILGKHKPTIAVSEWFAPRYDCSSRYRLIVHVVKSNNKMQTFTQEGSFEQWTEGIWEKVSIDINDYFDDVELIIYQHEGQDGLYWKGHYGIKMAGASLKFMFDSIKDYDGDELFE